MSIRTRLLLLTISILMPMLVGMGYALHLLQGQLREQGTQRLIELTHGLADSLERELAIKESVLTALALSPALARNDLPGFYVHARAAAPTFDRTLVLRLPSGEQVLNTRRPLDGKLSERSSLMPLRAAAGEDATIVSDLYFAPIGKQHSFAVEVPVKNDGKLVYYLAMGTFASNLQRLIDEQRYRPGWNASVIDRQGIIVARRVRPQDFVGKPATEEFRARMKASREGVFNTVRLDGEAVVTAFVPIGQTGWTAALSMPKSELAQPAREIYGFMVSLTGLLLVLALSGAWLIARSVNRSVDGLVDMARALGRNEPIPQSRSRMREAEVVSSELRAAGTRLRSINQTLEERVRAAVHENQRAQEALLQHQKLEALGRLTGGIAHDFNNILQTLNVTIELAARLAVRDSVKAALETGKRAVQKGTQLTRQLLAFGRATEAHLATIDLADHIREQLDLLRGALRENIEIRLELDPALWPVTLDPVQLDLALLNIALNARDAMPGGGRFTIRGRNAEVTEREGRDVPAGRYVCLEISDSGGGIPPEVLGRVFEPFFTTKEIGKGSGLGLAQVYGFVRQSGGAVTIASSLGEGTQLALYLPRSRHAPDKKAEAHEEPAANAGGTVLFVDDDPLIIRVMEPALRAEGFSVHCAANAAEALSVLDRHAVDVLLSDIVMPGGASGVDLANEAVARHPRLHVILATGYAASAPPNHGFPVLAKPYDLKQAVAAINDAMKDGRGSA